MKDERQRLPDHPAADPLEQIESAGGAVQPSRAGGSARIAARYLRRLAFGWPEVAREVAATLNRWADEGALTGREWSGVDGVDNARWQRHGVVLPDIPQRGTPVVYYLGGDAPYYVGSSAHFRSRMAVHHATHCLTGVGRWVAKECRSRGHAYEIESVEHERNGLTRQLRDQPVARFVEWVRRLDEDPDA